MAKFTSYPNKSKPADSDTLLINDTSASANKQILLSGLFAWLKDKFTNTPISGLETTNQTIVGAINELHDAVEESGGSGSGSGLNEDVKTALMNLVNHVAWDDDDPTGQTYITALQNALYPTVTTRTVSYTLSHVTSSNNASTVTSGASYTATLTASSGYTINTVTVTMGGADVTSTVYSSGTITIPSVTGNIVITATAVASVSSISAVYTQSGTVYTNTNLDSLKSDLVVTATYTGGTTSTIPVADYTLSGTLTEGTSTITVTYGGKTATFNVTVSTNLMYSLYNHEFTGDPVESPYIDTGIKLFDTDFSWTIICSVSREDVADRYGWRLLGALQSASPYNGFYHGSSNTQSSGTTNVKWVGSTNTAVNTYMKKAFVGTYKCAFVHMKDGGLQMYFKGNDDAVVTKTDNTAWTQITDAASLGIGGVPSNADTYAFTGTINKFEIYNYAFDSTAINAFMEDS